MSFDVSALNNWFDESSNKAGFITKSLLGNDTGALVKKVTGIKYKTPLNGFYASATIVAGGCDDSASGTSTFTQRVLEVIDQKDVELICAKDLLPKWMNAKMSAGSPDAVPSEIASIIMAEKARALANANEIAYWQETSLFDGWLKLLADLGFGGGGDPIKGNPDDITVGTGIVASNIMTIMDKQWALVPAKVKSSHRGEIVSFVGYDTFTTYGLKMRDLNLFHTPPPAGLEMGFVHPGTGLIVYPVGGLDGTHQIVTTWKENLIIGCDVDGEDTQSRWIEVNDKDYEGVKLKTEWKAGVQIALPEEVVYFKLHA